MRVGIDFRPPLFSRTGIARYATELVRALGDHDDVELSLYGDAWRAPLDPDACRRLVAESGAKLVRARVPGRLSRLLGRVGFGVESRLGRIDLFHCTDIVYPPVRAAPTVVTLHDVVFELDRSYHGEAFHRDVPARVRRAVEAASAVVTSSEETRARILERYPIDGERVAAIPLGADHVRYDAAVEPEVDALLRGRGVKAPFVLCVGTIEPRKNHRRLLDAFGAFAVDRPHHLVLAGGFGWLCDEVRDRLSRGAARVHHLDAVPDRLLPALYRRAQMSVYPSLYEGFGLPVLESMALGTPVVTARRGAIPEVGGDAVAWCDPEDPASIAAAMARLADDDATRADLSARGAERARSFSWAETARRTVDVYRRVAEGGRP